MSTTEQSEEISHLACSNKSTTVLYAITEHFEQLLQVELYLLNAIYSLSTKAGVH